MDGWPKLSTWMNLWQFEREIYLWIHNILWTETWLRKIPANKEGIFLNAFFKCIQMIWWNRNTETIGSKPIKNSGLVSYSQAVIKGPLKAVQNFYSYLQRDFHSFPLVIDPWSITLHWIFLSLPPFLPSLDASFSLSLSLSWTPFCS